ncbi:hypothetical protein AB0M12_41440 [Nocardia vinacea]|uniref:hypothetical protein n=1 Tax=Nocardia vinacea TaxID=96468 RepID=UPI0034478E20
MRQDGSSDERFAEYEAVLRQPYSDIACPAAPMPCPGCWPSRIRSCLGDWPKPRRSNPAEQATLVGIGYRFPGNQRGLIIPSIGKFDDPGYLEWATGSISPAVRI